MCAQKLTEYIELSKFLSLSGIPHAEVLAAYQACDRHTLRRLGEKFNARACLKHIVDPQEVANFIDLAHDQFRSFVLCDLYGPSQCLCTTSIDIYTNFSMGLCAL